MADIEIANPKDDLSQLFFLPKDLPNRPRVFFVGDKKDSSSNVTDSFVGPLEVTSSGVAHGLGVVARRDIQAGECLFVTRAVVSADVKLVFEEWKSRFTDNNATKGDNNIGTPQTLLEEVTEQVLVKAMRQKIQSQDDSDKAIVQSFLLQLSEGEESTARNIPVPTDPSSFVPALVARQSFSSTTAASPLFNIDTDISDTKLLEIIRRNAFGPDFASYQSVEAQWAQSLDDGTERPSPSRLLGLYPLAAMINHSCTPNAVRVFVDGDWMVVHASSNIPKGKEIGWSYLPPILSYPSRKKQLEERHGFVCHCARCINEKEACSTRDIFDLPESLNPFQKSGSILATSGKEARQQLTKDLLAWEERTFAANGLSNETRRYWKMGNASLYIHYLNAVLMDIPQDNPEQAAKTRAICLMKGMDLHFCFVSCHYACTEHLSIMHLCYELVAIMHSRSPDPSKTLPKVQFWTEQLKRAHLIRYGSLGSNVDRIRAVMKHTQVVLRNHNGLDKVPYDFI
ncbi:Protein msta, isoform [Seminavis robusta]|uniref:Protein msta, isoform n=1 Tax=Seminavis robusta TaxID=568900 RepID=A0A9N8F0L4_9STRA|nr:Protein msta, isoform [Seminavis robusta]|eukprot:Sro2229_g319940.1 Protein msta, isoform (512) ;mRNA; f:6653-8188